MDGSLPFDTGVSRAMANQTKNPQTSHDTDHKRSPGRDDMSRTGGGRDDDTRRGQNEPDRRGGQQGGDDHGRSGSKSR